jgi:hypothetical protein
MNDRELRFAMVVSTSGSVMNEVLKDCFFRSRVHQIVVDRSGPALWVPKTSPGTIDLDFRWRGHDDEDGAWRSPSSPLPSSVSSACSVSHVVGKRTWPSRSSCCPTKLASCTERWRVGPCGPRIERFLAD